LPIPAATVQSPANNAIAPAATIQLPELDDIIRSFLVVKRLPQRSGKTA
jgi:hypothetical protein